MATLPVLGREDFPAKVNTKNGVAQPTPLPGLDKSKFYDADEFNRLSGAVIDHRTAVINLDGRVGALEDVGAPTSISDGDTKVDVATADEINGTASGFKALSVKKIATNIKSTDDAGNEASIRASSEGGEALVKLIATGGVSALATSGSVYLQAGNGEAEIDALGGSAIVGGNQNVIFRPYRFDAGAADVPLGDASAKWLPAGIASIIGGITKALAGLPTSGAWAAETISTLPSGVSAAEFEGGRWSRVGDTVTCSGSIAWTGDDGAAPILTFAAPVPSAFSGTLGDAGGGTAFEFSSFAVAGVLTNVAADTLVMACSATSGTAERRYFFTVQYRVQAA